VGVDKKAEFFQFWAGEDTKRWSLLEGYTVFHEKYGRGEVKGTFKTSGSLHVGIQFEKEGQDGSPRRFIASKFKLYFSLPELPPECAEDVAARRSFEEHRESQEDEKESGSKQEAEGPDEQLGKLEESEQRDHERESSEMMRKTSKEKRMRIRRFTGLGKLLESLKGWLAAPSPSDSEKPADLSIAPTENQKRLTEEQVEIQKLVRERRIKEVVHFTRIENLHSILKHGLLPRKILNEMKISYIPADNNRYDGLLHASCLSISFPNYRMFWRLRQEQGGNWIILSFSPEILWQYECAFYPRNAADGEMRELSLASRKKPHAFAELFEDISGVVRRAQLNIPSYYTTDPQAEVVVFDVIQISMLQKIYVNDKPTKRKIEGIASSIGIGTPCSVEPYFFGPRQDYEHWKNNADRQRQNEKGDYGEVPF